VLEAAGVNLDLNAGQVAQCVDRIGVGFLFAPKHHGAMKHAIGPRKEMGVRTLFNLLGPLTNPASAPNQVLGVFSADWLEPLAQVLRRLGSKHVLVVHADDGLDEISIGSPTRVAELKGGEILNYRIEPGQFGIQTGDVAALAVAGPEESLGLVKQVLDDSPGPARDIVILNAGAAIYAAGLSETLEAGIEAARLAIATGKARQKLQDLIDFSNSF
jgi:anthranilate phosphoribosyltransferase